MLTTSSTLYCFSRSYSSCITGNISLLSNFPFPFPPSPWQSPFSLFLWFVYYVCMCVCVHAHTHAQSCYTLCNSMNCSLPGSFVHGVFQARILEWVAISSSRWSSWPRNWAHISCVSCIVRQILYHCTTYMTLTTLDTSHK